VVKWKAEVFFEWFEFFSELVHSHHDIEEKIFFPWIATKCPIPDKHMKGHVELVANLKKLGDYSKKFDKDGLADLAKEFFQEWDTFVTDMEAHLAEEETDIPPILVKHFTKKENDKTVEKVLSFLGFEGNQKELPWIVDGMIRWRGYPETKKWMKDHLPGPVRLLWKQSWRETFDANYTNRLEMLALETEPKRENCVLQ